MPRSRRNKVVALTQTSKKTLEHKKKLLEAVREAIDENKYVWLFSVGDMRNEGLKEVRKQWKGTGRIVYGKNKVIAKALGETPETEHKEGLSQIAKRLHGPLGIFLTSWDVKETQEWFDDFSRPAYARMGAPASQEVILPEGPIRNIEGDTFPHSMEPQLRSCGLATSLVKGVPSLKQETVVCRKGEKLTAEKARLLQLLGYFMATFRVKLGSRWSEEEGFVEGQSLDDETFEAGAGEGEDDDDMDA